MDATKCVACKRGSDVTPLLAFEYRGSSFRICAQHMPILIHHPEQLIGLLEGAETMEPAEHED